MGINKPRPPGWLRVSDEDLLRLDPGRKYAPFTAAEINAGIVLRGPAVFAATPMTKDESRNDLPIPCHHMYLSKLPTGRWEMQFSSSPKMIRSIAIEPRIIVDRRTKSLLIPTVNHGVVRLRPIKLGDKSLYTSGIDFDATSVEVLVQSLWESEWL